MPEFSHIEGDAVRMVDVTGKAEVHRKAVATGRIHLLPETLAAIREGTVVKGNVLATARVAATMAVKDTSRVIPMCHPIPIGGVEVGFTEGDGFLEATVEVKSTGRTGVEMEALTGVTVALLTVWDMVKSAEKDPDGQYPVTRIEGIRVVEKRKGGARPAEGPG
ncbi:MAG: cyclic pyranopterin monophosphate synthase MoaC [Methanomicrobiales archaeon]|nr:cyclic pyranopterin monophosphate synthase MoaC [Methanomicrobiales archaeon]